MLPAPPSEWTMHGVPMPAVVLVDAEGTIRWIDVHPNYTTRTEVPQIIAALDLL